MDSGENPFRYWIIDDYITPYLVSEINKKWPEGLRFQDKLTSKKYHTTEFDGCIKNLSNHFLSKKYLEFLENLTGLSVIADTSMKGGGLHEVKNGGFLKKHIDFNVMNTKAGLHKRRLNCLLYLNEGWKEEWGGHLVLYDTELNPVKKIAPIAGRLVIFETSDISWHGHPEPLKCPPDRSRRSMAFYYYSSETYPKTLDKVNTTYRD